jgi:hypothetical protein
MSLAEQLRAEQPNIHKEMPWLKESVVNNIKYRGEYRIICDKHISRIDENFAVPNRYWNPIKEWAESEGLRVYATYNRAGVRSLCISL